MRQAETTWRATRVPARSPRIAACGWGRIEVEGVAAPLRDAVLYPGGAHEWNWRLSDTGHRAGVQPAAVRELLERGVRAVVLSRGWLALLRIPPETLSALASHGIRVEVARTGAAVARYNALAAAGVRVGALIHSTC